MIAVSGTRRVDSRRVRNGWIPEESRMLRPDMPAVRPRNATNQMPYRRVPCLPTHTDLWGWIKDSSSAPRSGARRTGSVILRDHCKREVLEYETRKNLASFALRVDISTSAIVLILQFFLTQRRHKQILKIRTVQQLIFDLSKDVQFVFTLLNVLRHFSRKREQIHADLLEYYSSGIHQVFVGFDPDHDIRGFLKMCSVKLRDIDKVRKQMTMLVKRAKYTDYALLTFFSRIARICLKHECSIQTGMRDEFIKERLETLSTDKSSKCNAEIFHVSS